MSGQSCTDQTPRLGQEEEKALEKTKDTGEQGQRRHQILLSSTLNLHLKTVSVYEGVP